MTTEPTPAPAVSSTAEGILQDIKVISGSLATATEDVSTAGLWSAICGFFTALPGIISLIKSFMNWLKIVSGNNPQAYIANLGKAFDQLASAQTQAQQQQADQTLAGDIGKMPS
jgi:hypothetical protein